MTWCERVQSVQVAARARGVVACSTSTMKSALLKKTTLLRRRRDESPRVVRCYVSTYRPVRNRTQKQPEKSPLKKPTTVGYLSPRQLEPARADDPRAVLGPPRRRLRVAEHSFAESHPAQHVVPGRRVASDGHEHAGLDLFHPLRTGCPGTRPGRCGVRRGRGRGRGRRRQTPGLAATRSARGAFVEAVGARATHHGEKGRKALPGSGPSLQDHRGVPDKFVLCGSGLRRARQSPWRHGDQKLRSHLPRKPDRIPPMIKPPPHLTPEI